MFILATLCTVYSHPQKTYFPSPWENIFGHIVHKKSCRNKCLVLKWCYGTRKKYRIWFLPPSRISSGILQGKFISVNWLLCYRSYLSPLITHFQPLCRNIFTHPVHIFSTTLSTHFRSSCAHIFEHTVHQFLFILWRTFNHPVHTS